MGHGIHPGAGWLQTFPLQPFAVERYLYFRKPNDTLYEEALVDPALLIPISVFVCIAYSIKVCVDASVRRRVVEIGGSAERVDSMLREEQQRRRYASLRWGIVLLSIGLGFGLVQWIGWKEVTPGLIAVLAAATGLGNLLFFMVSRRLT